ncbi:major facilitator superfamily domain-containing protein [Trichoderma breve]|uniref:Major facilitator superfamily domain-containing protein n=1 Tax=Trichoderma breve TaxID=2034170 RepID=A0A9W9EDQ6_9HYPO|nr:major facilitator superfamily domain-containing protein [Trichoderma breve]KAJ4864798.1 major facilitator superfamily domain-containing protein [Trichoderma breve]
MTGPKRISDDRSPSPTIREIDNDRDSDVTETSQLLGPEGYGARKDSWDNDVDFQHLPWWRRPSVFWLLGPYAVFTLAFGGLIVPKLNLILDLVCKQYFADQQLINPHFTYKPIVLGSDNPQCNIPEVQRNVATFMLGLNLIIGGLSAIVAPKLGKLSDRYGRRKLMALASCGGLLSEVVTILCAKYPQVFNYRWMLVGAMFDGITGSFTAGSILSQSYTSDCTPPSRRAVSIGYVHACLFTGLAVGPLLAGYFVKWTGTVISIFYVALGCHAFFIVFVRFIMPESLSKRRQMLAREKLARSETSEGLLPARRVHNPFEAFEILWPTGPGTSSRLRINLVALAIADTIIMGSMMAVGNCLMLYSEYMFGWGTFETSRFISLLSMIRVVVLMVLFPIINYVFRIRPAARRRRESGAPAVEVNTGADNLDIWLLRFALTSDVLGCIGYTLSRNQHLFFASGMITALGGLGSATVQAAVTKHVPASRVGQVLGAVGFMQALSRVVGPLMFNGLYAVTVATFPQAIFVLLGGLFCIGLICAFIIKPHVHWEDVGEEDEEPLNQSSGRFEASAGQLISAGEETDFF